MTARPVFLTPHMEMTILEMTLDKFPLREIIQELRRLYPNIKERDIRFAISWTRGER
jgi:hypothetical protein